MKPLSINSIEHITFSDAPAYAQIRTECEELAAIAEAIACPYIVVVPGRFPPGGLSSYEVIEESVRVLRELASIAERHSVALAFEFLGQKDCSVQTLELADEIVQKVNRRNIGLVIDSFHFYVGGSTIKMIDALDPKRLFIFHINDAEDLPLDQLTDAHRLLPGLGILKLKEIIEAFKRIGYDGVASVEIFRPEYWERDPFELAREAKAATEKVVLLGFVIPFSILGGGARGEGAKLSAKFLNPPSCFSHDNVPESSSNIMTKDQDRFSGRRIHCRSSRGDFGA